MDTEKFLVIDLSDFTQEGANNIAKKMIKTLSVEELERLGKCQVEETLMEVTKIE